MSLSPTPETVGYTSGAGIIAIPEDQGLLAPGNNANIGEDFDNLQNGGNVQLAITDPLDWLRYVLWPFSKGNPPDNTPINPAPPSIWPIVLVGVAGFAIYTWGRK